MAQLVLEDRSVRVKIVYYGPHLSGKTTNLQQLYSLADSRRRGELVSRGSLPDRTVFFDLPTLQASCPRGFEIRLRLVTVPGKAPCALSRRMALRGVDGIVFVAHSAQDRREENRQSLRELEEHLSAQDLDPECVPLVMQFNQRDLPGVSSPAEMDADLNPGLAPVWTAVAKQGEGVLETLRSILMTTMRDVWRRYPLFGAESELPAEAWVRCAMTDIFAGTTAQAARSQARATLPQPARVHCQFAGRRLDQAAREAYH